MLHSNSCVPANWDVEMRVICPSCRAVHLLKQKSPFYSGFSSRGFLYCDETPAILEFSVYNARYVSIVGDKHPWCLNDEERRKLEQSLKPCPLGGRFRFGAHPRCPACCSLIPDLLQDEIHFLEIGTVVNGDIEDVWQSE